MKTVVKAPVEAVRRLLAEKGLLQGGKSLLCAVSGGADSMALLYSLHLLQGEYGFALRALHVQHGLRGEESTADEAFVRDFCRQYAIPLTVRDAGLCGSMEDAGMETKARESRLRIFREEAQGMAALLLAHHRDDQTETVLMHLLRGTGEGICGMPAAKKESGLWILRPFLNLPKEELLRFLEEEGIPHREDSSNRDCVTPRNRLRLEILPQLEAMFPGCSGRIVGYAENAAVESAYLMQHSQSLYREAGINAAGLNALRLAALRNQPQALVRRVLRLWVGEALHRDGPFEGEQNLSREQTLALLALLQSDAATLNLPHDLRSEKGRWLLCLRNLNEAEPTYFFSDLPVSEKPEGTVRHLSCFGTEFEIRFCPKEEAVSVPDSPDTVFLPLPAEGTVLRLPRPGDRIRPLGAPGHKPYRRYLTDIRMDACLRPLWPVLACDHELLWVPGLCTSEALRLKCPPPDCLRIRILSGLIPTILSEEKESVCHGKQS